MRIAHEKGDYRALQFMNVVGKILHELDPIVFPSAGPKYNDFDEFVEEPTYCIPFFRWWHPYIYQILRLTGDTYLLLYKDFEIVTWEVALDTRIYPKHYNIYTDSTKLTPAEIYDIHFAHAPTKTPEEIEAVVRKYIDLDKIDKERIRKFFDKYEDKKVWQKG